MDVILIIIVIAVVLYVLSTITPPRSRKRRRPFKKRHGLDHVQPLGGIGAKFGWKFSNAMSLKQL